MIFLPDTLVGVRQFLCGGRFDAYSATEKAREHLGNGWIFPKNTIMMIKQTGRLVGACRFVLAGDGLTLTTILYV